LNKLEGVCPILNTPFREDGSLDLDSQLRLVRYLLDAGAHALGLFGNASEGYTLMREERRTLLRVIAKEVCGRVPLVVSSGHTGTDAAVETSREAADLGAAGLMVLPPFFLRTDADGLMFYFEAISRAVQLPIIVQDAPLMTQVAMPPALLARIAREIEHVEYVKVEAPPTAPKCTAIRALTDQVVLFGGLNGQFFIEEFLRGSRGTMPGSDLIPQFVQIWNHLEEGNLPSAWQRFVRCLPLIRYELQPGLGVSAMKNNLVARSVIRCARVRHPTASLDACGLSELQRLREWVDSEPMGEPAPAGAEIS
jgi:4-hydroxy-tetrahydrodipicolinate synthase